MSIDSEKKFEAFQRYKAGAKSSDIAEDLALSVHTIRHWISKGTSTERPWNELKDMDLTELETLMSVKGVLAKDLIGMGDTILYRSMRKHLDNDKALSFQEMASLTRVLKELEHREQAFHAEEAVSIAELEELDDEPNEELRSIMNGNNTIDRGKLFNG